MAAEENVYSRPFIKKRSDGRYQGVSKYRDDKGTWRQRTCLVPKRLISERSIRRYVDDWWGRLGSSNTERPAAVDEKMRDAELGTILHSGFTVVEMIQFMLDDKLTSGVIERSTYSKEMTTLRRVERHPIGAMDIDDVTEADCLAFFRYLIKDRGLCINTVRVSQLQLKSAYWYFLRERRTANNPMQFIKLFPKHQAKTSPQRGH